MAGPHFFVDRSLGRHRVPNLLRKDGWSLVTLAEHYGIPADETVADVDWLELAGQNRWPVLMKDEKIRYRPAERAAVRAHDVRAFYLTSGNLTGQQMADLFIANRDVVWRMAVEAGPALFAVFRGAVRQIDLTD
jgi:hypothetical protein